MSATLTRHSPARARGRPVRGAVAARGSPGAGRWWASSTFRLALLYTLVFTTSVTALLGFLYWASAGFMARQTDATIGAEIEVLAERYRLAGLAGVADLIRDRVTRGRDPGGVYLLVDPLGRPLAGNLAVWPGLEPDPAGWIDVDLERTGADAGARPVRARAYRLGGGFRLLAGRDVGEWRAVRALLRRSLGAGVALALAFSLAGGVLLARSTGRRIEAIRATAGRIVAGDLGERVPRDGSGDDFDRLAASLNDMLERIEALMDDVRRVTDNVAHDLRTPLTRLRARLEALRAGPPALPAPALDAALDEADRLLRTFSALLRIARVESGARRAGHRTFDLAAVVRDAVDLYEPEAERRGVRIVTDAPDRADLGGDRDLVFQAIANLLDNAVKFSPAGGEVTVSLAREATAGAGPAFVVRVRDRGPGIAPADRPHVGKRFYRGEAARTTPGNGLGLALVVAVARRHGGALAIEDARPGLRAGLTLRSGGEER